MPVCFRMTRRSSRSRRRSLASRFDKRLVEQQQLRPVDDAARQRHALHLPARQRHHRPVGIFGQTDQRQHFLDLAVGIRARHLPVLQRIDHVLPHRHMRPHRIGLEHHAEVARARRHQNAALRATTPPCRRSKSSPPVGCSRPATQRSVVVLPQPEGPSSTTISPAGTSKLTPSIAGRPIANCFRRSVTSSVAVMIHRVPQRCLTADSRRSCPSPRPSRRAASRTGRSSDTRP